MRIARLILVSLMLCPLARSAPAVDDAQRELVYKEFRAAFDAKQYSTALPSAEKLVALTEQQYGADHVALVNPLSNLGTVYYRMENYASAEIHFQRAVRLLEAKGGGGGVDHQLIRPLHGLGETWFAAQQYSEAAAALKRAIDISRNSDGLFNVEQLPILTTLIDSYIALGRRSDADKEQQYAFRVAESNFGPKDLRLLEPLDRYARWFESDGRYLSARALHSRGLQLAEEVGGPARLRTVTPLRGIARTYYLEFLFGADKKEESALEPDPFALPSNSSNSVSRLNPDGEKALRLAIAALTKSTPVDQHLRGDTLIDLGDWYLVSGEQAKAKDIYHLAWLDLAAVQSTRRLAAPRQLVYRPPLGSVARVHPSKPAEWEEKTAEMSFQVTSVGTVTDIKLIKANVSESLVKGVTLALHKSLYAPRIEAGVAEATNDVRFVEHLLVRKPSAPTPAPAAPATTTKPNA